MTRWPGPTRRRPGTAWREAQQGFPFKAQPLTICQYDVDCADVVDLTDPSVLAAAGIREFCNLTTVWVA